MVRHRNVKVKSEESTNESESPEKTMSVDTVSTPSAKSDVANSKQ
jgi:hypothetical protein